MAQVNKTIYPDVSTGTYYTATKTISGSNFPNQLGIGLEKSITYTMSTNPRAPYNSLFYTHLTNDSNNQLVEIYSQVQRIALLQGWPQAFGSDRCGSISYISNPWNENFTSSSPLYSAYKWNAIVGRLCCTWYVDPEGHTFTNSSNYYNGTWADFKSLVQQGGHEYILVSVWVEVYGGGLGTNVNDRRLAGIKGMNLYKVPIYAWDAQNNYNMVHVDGFLYAPMRPMMNFGSVQYNNFNSNGSNQADCCWPVYNYGYGISGASPDTFGYYDVRGRIIYGVDEDLVNSQYTFAGDFGSSGHKTFGISATAYGATNLINLIERKAACLGIIMYTNCHSQGDTAQIPTDTVAHVFDRSDIICPIMTEDGYYNGDFITTAEEAPGTSAEALIGGDKDAPFDDGGGTVDPEPEPPTPTNGLTFTFEKGTGEDANYFLLNFGVAVSSAEANFYPTARGTVYPDLPGEYDGHRLIPFFGSPRYQPVLRWQSLRTLQNYEVPIKNIVGLQENWLYNALEQDGFDFLYSGVERTYTWDKGNVNSAMRCLHWPIGIANTIDDWDTIGPVEAAADYSTWKSFPVLQQFSLGEVVSYMKTMEPGFENDDIYSELFLDFVNVETGNVNATLSVDYSALYNTGTDPNGGGGGSSSSADNQWGNDDTDPRLNPDEVINIPMVKPNLGPVGIFNKTYAINSNDLQQLSDIISSNDDDVFDEVLEGLKMFGANPINALVDLRLYPYDVAQQLNVSATKEIILGRYETGINGVNLAGGSSVSILDLGEIYISEHYKSFLDYEPYTVINLYIPYIGTVELPPSQFMNKTASVRMVVDYTTGAALAVIYSNGIPIIFQNGVIGTSIAMTGDSAAAYANGIIGNFLGAAGSAARAIGSAVAKPTPGTITNAVTTGITSIANALDSINETHFQQAGSASPCCNNCTPQKCYLTIARPVLAFQSDFDIILYGEHIGYATQYTAVIQNLTGTGIYYGVLSEHDQVAAGEPTPTAKEIDLIKQALNNGFFLSQSHLGPNSQ